LVAAALLVCAHPQVDASVEQRVPDCTSPEAWPASMAYVTAKNAGLLSPDTVDTSRTRVTRLASETLADGTFQQVHLVTFFLRDGSRQGVVAVGRVSREECSFGETQNYFLQRQRDFTLPAMPARDGKRDRQ